MSTRIAPPALSQKRRKLGEARGAGGVRAAASHTAVRYKEYTGLMGRVESQSIVGTSARSRPGSEGPRCRSRGSIRAGLLAFVLGPWVALVLSSSLARGAPDRSRAPTPGPMAHEPELPRLRPGSLPSILAAVRKPGVSAVLLNVWASWCEPCLEELPELLRFYRDHRQRGLRLVMVSADDLDQEPEARRALQAAALSAGLGGTTKIATGTAAAATLFGAVVFIKDEDDTAFVNGLDPGWSGALPVTFVYDRLDERQRLWRGPVTYAALEEATRELLGLTAPKTAPPR